jgi:PAS domain S-box-containing protein
MSRLPSLRLKLIVLTFSLLLGFSLVLGLYLKALFADQLSDELLKRGVSIARLLSTLSANAFIENDVLYLDYLAKDQRQTEADIVYILMLDSHGKVLAHSFDESYPLELADANRLEAGAGMSIARIRLDGGKLIYDIAVPVLDGRPGTVRLGLSADTVSTAVQTLIQQVLLAILLTGLVAVALAILASRRISRPIVMLTRAVEALARGDREQQLPVVTQDEIGRLTNSFNQMVVQLGNTEQRLEFQRRFLEILIDDIPTPVFYKDHQGLMLGCNRAYCEFWGQTKDNVIGRKALKLYPEGESGLHAQKDAEVFRTGQPVRYEISIVDATGNPRNVVIHKAPFKNPVDNSKGLVGVIMDISSERRADRMRREFVSTVAHEFQTPLTVILGYADLLKEKGLTLAESGEALETIEATAQKLSLMVDELLDMSRLETGRKIMLHPQEIDLRPLLFEVIQNFRDANHGHSWETRIPDPPLPCRGDPVRLRQVVDNLLSNAAKYSADETTIQLSAGRDGQSVWFSVTDQGVGMSDEEAEHLFEKFYRADTSETAPPRHRPRTLHQQGDRRWPPRHDQGPHCPWRRDAGQGQSARLNSPCSSTPDSSSRP